jgi:hypothetical protein
MNNNEFAINLKDHLLDCGWVSVEDEEEEDSIIDCIETYLNGDNLQVINTKQQLLGYCSDDVVIHYENNVEDYQSRYPSAPDELTVEQSHDLLEWADRLNSGHDLGFCCDDIDDAIEEWLEENYVS